MEEKLLSLNGKQVLSKNGKRFYFVKWSPGEKVQMGHPDRGTVSMSVQDIKIVYDAACRGERVLTTTIPELLGRHDAARTDSTMLALVLALCDSSRVKNV